MKKIKHIKQSQEIFDLVVIDECHRGSANEDPTCEILEYFDSAIHLGMTVTPKETKYASNINYFEIQFTHIHLNKELRKVF